MKLLIIALITFLAKKGFINIPDLKWFSKNKDKDDNLKSK
tara:strand:+ start:655 stop:774 length:120 start_codon:yes stop_codon:yes gene_type:complete